jgi:hypothetical protein
MSQSQAIAWVVVTAIPIVGIWGLVTGLRNPFTHSKTKDTPLYRGVAANVGNYLGATDVTEQREAMARLVKAATLAGAKPGLPAFTLVAKWIKDFQKMTT